MKLALSCGHNARVLLSPRWRVPKSQPSKTQNIKTWGKIAGEHRRGPRIATARGAERYALKSPGV
jgi:hypothetical protein